MVKIEEKNLEKLTGCNAKILAEAIKVPTSTMYERKKNGNWNHFYKLAIIGYRIVQSPIPTRKIFKILKAIEISEGK